MAFLIVVICIVVLVLLITWAKLNPFLTFLSVSVMAGFLLGIPLPKIVSSVQKGIGDTLGSLAIVIALGAMFGKIVAESGAAKKIATVLVDTFGIKYVQWALMIAGFIIGIPLFYGVGFVLLVPLIFSVVYQYKLSAVYIGLPMLAALSVTHGFLPPHPSPIALVAQLNANIGLTLLYGIVVAIPAIVIAGPIYSKTLKSIRSEPLQIFQPEKIGKNVLPGTKSSFIISLLPVFLLILAAVLQNFYAGGNPEFNNIILFLGDPVIVMLVSLFVATYFLGIRLGKKVEELMSFYTDSIKEIGMILLIIAGAGALKQVLTDSGVSTLLGEVFQSWQIHPLVLGWLIAAIIRICIGSATVAGLTTAGIIAPLMIQMNVNPNLMVLSIGAGSLMFSHVNDAGFWLFKEYFNLSIKDTLRSWSVMESIVSVVGLSGVLLLNSWL